MSWHVSEEMMKRFFRAELETEDLKRVVRHLLTECRGCQRTSQKVASQGYWLSEDDRQVDEAIAALAEREAYGGAFGKLSATLQDHEWKMAHEKLRGVGQWFLLEPLAPADRLATLAADQRLHNWGLFHRALDASREIGRRDPAAALRAAELALAVVDHLAPSLYSAEQRADFRAAAYGALGNARRQADDFGGAREALRKAWTILAEGTGDPLERAGLIRLEASLTCDLGDFEEASQALEEALTIYNRLGDPHQVGRTILQQGNTLGHLDPERGIALVRQALALIVAEREPRLELCARHDLIWFLNDAGRSAEALRVLELSRTLYRQFPDDWTQLRLHWLQGRLARALGALPEAEGIFRSLWGEFHSRNLHQELTLVSIDLSEVLVDREDVDAGAELMSRVADLLTAWGMHKEGLGVWLLMRNALAKRTAKATAFQEAARYYRRAWYRPVHFKDL